MKTTDIKAKLNSGELDLSLSSLYGEHLDVRKARLTSLADKFVSVYGDRDVNLFSVPGRSELAGNHTDHNCGMVIAASVDLDIIAAAAKRDDGIIRLQSEGFPEDTVNINEYTSPVKSDFGRSASLIAGMCDGFRKNGYRVGGFDALTTSNVLKGSGLSSSAAFEVMVGNILNYLYNDGKISNVEIAKIAQYAENVFFGKPCGLMDQTACAVGGIVAIDFADTKAPVIEKIEFDISAAGYRLCIVDTGGNHADLTDDYASIPSEMKAVAAYFGKANLRETDKKDFYSKLPELRKALGDRPVLRAMHYFSENHRVISLASALKNSDILRFFDGVNESGISSFCYLQNAYSVKDVSCQGVSVAVCLAKTLLEGRGGACRLHGGGFAGTIQAYVPARDCAYFKYEMEKVFGEGSCYVLRIRNDGAVKII